MKRTDRPRARRRTGMTLSETHRPTRRRTRCAWGIGRRAGLHVQSACATLAARAEVRAASRDRSRPEPRRVHRPARIRHARDEGAADEPANAHGKGARTKGGSAQSRIPVPADRFAPLPEAEQPSVNGKAVRSGSKPAQSRLGPGQARPASCRIRNCPVRSLPQKPPPSSRPAPGPPQKDAKPRLQATTCPICLTMYLATCALRAPTSRPPTIARNCWCRAARIPRPCQQSKVNARLV